MPGLPGAAWSSSTSGLCTSFQASACSRPPDPTKSTFTGASVLPSPGVSNGAIGHIVSMVEPGLDRHEWESQWASLEDDFGDDPADSLRHVHELMTRALTERGILANEQVTVEGADPELVAPWAAGGELVQKLDAGLDVEEADIREALESYRELFRTLLAERSSP